MERATERTKGTNVRLTFSRKCVSENMAHEMESIHARSTVTGRRSNPPAFSSISFLTFVVKFIKNHLDKHTCPSVRRLCVYFTIVIVGRANPR